MSVEDDLFSVRESYIPVKDSKSILRNHIDPYLNEWVWNPNTDRPDFVFDGTNRVMPRRCGKTTAIQRNIRDKQIEQSNLVILVVCFNIQMARMNYASLNTPDNRVLFCGRNNIERTIIGHMIDYVYTDEIPDPTEVLSTVNHRLLSNNGRYVGGFYTPGPSYYGE